MIRWCISMPPCAGGAEARARARDEEKLQFMARALFASRMEPNECFYNDGEVRRKRNQTLLFAAEQRLPSASDELANDGSNGKHVWPRARVLANDFSVRETRAMRCYLVFSLARSLNRPKQMRVQTKLRNVACFSHSSIFARN